MDVERFLPCGRDDFVSFVFTVVLLILIHLVLLRFGVFTVNDWPDWTWEAGIFKSQQVAHFIHGINGLLLLIRETMFFKY